MGKKQGTRDGLYRREKTWWVSRDPVTGKRKSTGCTDRAAARLWRVERERIAASPADARAKVEVVGVWFARLNEEQTREGGPSKSKHCLARLGPWVRIIGNDVVLADVTPDLVDHYVGARRDEGVKDSTILKEMSYIRQALMLAKRSGAYPGDIASLTPPGLHSDYVPRSRALSPTEVTALLQVLPESRAAFVAVTTLLGLRYGEALALRPEDIDLEAGTVHVRGTKTDESDDTIPILEPFRAIVAMARDYLPVPEWGNACRDLAVACRRIGIERCTPNDLRRTHCTMLVSAGVPLDVARRLMRHATSAMVERVYGKPTPQAVGALAAAAQLPALSADGFGTKTAQQVGSEPENTQKAGTPDRTRTYDQWIRKPGLPTQNGLSCGDPQDGGSQKPLNSDEVGNKTVQRRHSAEVASPAAWSLLMAYEAVLTRRAA
jgi:integrase